MIIVGLICWENEQLQTNNRLEKYQRRVQSGGDGMNCLHARSRSRAVLRRLAGLSPATPKGSLWATVSPSSTWLSGPWPSIVQVQRSPLCTCLLHCNLPRPPINQPSFQPLTAVRTVSMWTPRGNRNFLCSDTLHPHLQEHTTSTRYLVDKPHGEFDAARVSQLSHIISFSI